MNSCFSTLLVWSVFLTFSVQSNETYGYLGNSLYLHLNVENILNSSDFMLKKDNTLVFKVNKAVIQFYQEYRNRIVIYPNGTIRLNGAQATDSGNYIVEMFDASGTMIHKATHSVIIIESVVEGVLGSSVFFHLKNKAHGAEMKWSKGGAVVASLIKDYPRYSGYYKDRTQIFTNGTLRLHKIQENDLGIYTVNVTDKDKNNSYIEYAELLISNLIELPCVYGATACSVTLFIEHMDGRNISDAKWKKGENSLAEFKGPTPCYYGEYGSRAEIFTNGTLRLDRTLKTDTGNYSMEFFDNKIKQKWIAQLFIIDAVSQPVLKYSCLPDGEVQFYCSVENGSDPVFQWSLNGNTLDGESVFHSIRNHVLVVYNDSGSLVCSAQNHVSKKQSDLVSFTCAGRRSMNAVIWYVVAVVVGIALFVCIPAVATHKQNNTNPQPQTNIMLLTPVPQKEDEMPDFPSPPEDIANELSTFTC
ncbi:pregnancy-specific glycoprotein 22-like [Polyodon spathula]|uniref:pregnancy-specific glycoprotein 22-like n=1 Tax=Polyodon spathula TaxID=7913 RepID=UPI001B7F76D0|nr:pregnancy-specific glycoprotein 22-like [Polyodon spathula]